MRGCASSPTTSPTSGPPASSAIAPISPRSPIAAARSSGETACHRAQSAPAFGQSTSQIMMVAPPVASTSPDGDGYFEVELLGGRAGNTHHLGQLVTQQGYAVQPAITVPEGAIAPDGTVGNWAKPTDPRLDASRAFHQSGRLQAIGDNSRRNGRQRCCRVAPAGEQAIFAGHARGASTVNIVEELVEMIEAQRAYEISSKMVSAEMLRNADERQRYCLSPDPRWPLAGRVRSPEGFAAALPPPPWRPRPGTARSPSQPWLRQSRGPSAISSRSFWSNARRRRSRPAVRPSATGHRLRCPTTAPTHARRIVVQGIGRCIAGQLHPGRPDRDDCRGSTQR